MSWHVATKVGLLVGMMFLTACGGDEGNDGDGDNKPSSVERPGMGASTKTPEGTAFTLPAGLEWLPPTIKGYSAATPEKCNDQDEAKGRGSGDLVRLCLGFRNTSGKPITVTFPRGLIFISDKVSTQNGILVQTVSIEVPPSQAFFVPLFMYCLNQGRSASYPDDDFRQGPVTQYQDFQELFTLLGNKRLQPSGMYQIQHAVWHLSNGEGLTQSDRDAIAQLQ